MKKKIKKSLRGSKNSKRTNLIKSKAKLYKNKQIKINNLSKTYLASGKKRKRGLGKITRKKENTRKTKKKQKGGTNSLLINQIKLIKENNNFILTATKDGVSYKIIIPLFHVIETDIQEIELKFDSIYYKLNSKYYRGNSKLISESEKPHKVHNNFYVCNQELLSCEQLLISCFLDLDVILNCKPLYFLQQKTNDEDDVLCCYFKIGENLYFYDKASKASKQYIIVKENGNPIYFRNTQKPIEGDFVITLEDLEYMFSDNNTNVLYFEGGEPSNQIGGLVQIAEHDGIEFDNNKIDSVNSLLAPIQLRISVKKISQLLDESKRNNDLLTFANIYRVDKNNPFLILYKNDEMIATFEFDRETIDTFDNVEIMERTSSKHERQGYASLLLNILLYIIKTPRYIMSHPVVYQSFFSTLKYDKLKIRMSIKDEEYTEFSNLYIEPPKNIKIGSKNFKQGYLDDVVIDRLKEIYVNFKRERNLNKVFTNLDEAKTFPILSEDLFKVFFSFSGNNNLSLIRGRDFSIFIPVDDNINISLIGIQEFVKNTSTTN